MERNKKQVYTEYLIVSSRQGDERAFTELVGLWQSSLLKFAFRMTGASTAAHDIIQDSWVAVSRQLFWLQDPACFRRWVYRIVSNKCVDWIRKQQRTRKLKENYQQSLIGCECRDQKKSDRIDLVRTAISELDFEQRLLVNLYYMENLNLNEIAYSLKIPGGTVKSRLFKVRKILKSKMEKEF